MSVDLWRYYERNVLTLAKETKNNNCVRSPESATTAPVTTAQRTARWTRWTTGTSRTIPSPGWGTTWRPAAGGARTTSGAGGNSPVRRWWRLSRRPRNAWSPIPNWCLPTCTRRWRPIWTSRGNPCGGTCSSTKRTTHSTCTINKLHWVGDDWDCCTPFTVSQRYSFWYDVLFLSAQQRESLLS